MSRFDFWRRWLEGMAWLLVLFGLAVALINQSAVADMLVNRHVDPAFFADMPAEASAFQAWIYGVLGATIAGWGACMVAVVRVPFTRRQVWSWNAIAIGVSLWFVVDTTISALHGVWFNVGFNVVAAAMLGLPLAGTRGEFRTR